MKGILENVTTEEDEKSGFAFADLFLIMLLAALLTSQPKRLTTDYGSVNTAKAAMENDSPVKIDFTVTLKQDGNVFINNQQVANLADQLNDLINVEKASSTVFLQIEDGTAWEKGILLKQRLEEAKNLTVVVESIKPNSKEK